MSLPFSSTIVLWHLQPLSPRTLYRLDRTSIVSPKCDLPRFRPLQLAARSVRYPHIHIHIIVDTHHSKESQATDPATYTRRDQASVQHGLGLSQARQHQTTRSRQSIHSLAGNNGNNVFTTLRSRRQRTLLSDRRLQNRDPAPVQTSRRPCSTDRQLCRALQPADINL